MTEKEQQVIQVDDTDARVAREAVGKIAAQYQALGEEAARHRAVEMYLLQQLKELSNSYATIIETMASKYCPSVEEGAQWNFLPELGAFARAGERQDEQCSNHDPE